MAKARNKAKQKVMDNAAQFVSTGTVTLSQKTVNITEDWDTLTEDERRKHLADQGLTEAETEVAVRFETVKGKDYIYVPALNGLERLLLASENVQHIGHELPKGFATWQELLERSDEYAKENPVYRQPYVKTHGVPRTAIEQAAKFEADNK